MFGNIYGTCWEIYGTCWEIYETCWEIHGTCWEIHGKCWEVHGKCWEIHGKCWEIHGKSWDSSWKEFGNICEGSFDLAFVAWVSMHWSLQPNLRDHLTNRLIDLLVHMAYGFQQESFKIKCMNLQVLFNQLIIMFIPQRFVSWIVNVSIFSLFWPSKPNTRM